MPYLRWFKSLGYTVHTASNGDESFPDVDVKHSVSFERSPLKPANLSAYRRLKNIINSTHFDIIHCHTPVAAMLTRLAARKARKKGTKVIYTAHGFHFFKGAPMLNWLVYFPVEWLCSFFTDLLITINTEDYAFAKHRLHAVRTEFVPGVGVDSSALLATTTDRDAMRAGLGISPDAIVLLSVGELNRNKNHRVVVEAMKNIPVDSLYYVICGKGGQLDLLNAAAEELGISEKFKPTGFRSDVYSFYRIADIFVFPSLREGLSVSLMEAMVSGLPCVVSDIRGNRDLIQNGKGGYLCPPAETSSFEQAIGKLALDAPLRKNYGEFNRHFVEKYSFGNVMDKMAEIYYGLLK